MNEYTYKNNCMACDTIKDNCNHNGICEDCDVLVQATEPIKPYFKFTDIKDRYKTLLKTMSRQHAKEKLINELLRIAKIEPRG